VMRRTPVPTLPSLLAVALALAACGSPVAAPTATPADATPAATATEEPATEPTAEPTEVEATVAPTEDPSAVADVEVRVRTGDFDPRELTIQVGTTVGFHNTSNFGHTITEGTGGRAAPGAIVDEPIGRDGTVLVTFDEPGTYEITCRLHPTMQMTIIVEG
jgi:plastocyanin